MFTSCENKGFQIQFSNGYKVSCQFGVFNYCSRWSVEPNAFRSEMNEKRVSSENCEVAIIDTKAADIDNCFVTGRILKDMGLDIENDTMVAGYVSADDVGKIIAYVKDLEAANEVMA